MTIRPMQSAAFPQFISKLWRNPVSLSIQLGRGVLRLRGRKAMVSKVEFSDGKAVVGQPIQQAAGRHRAS